MTLAFAVLGGLGAWSAHLLASYWITSALCPSGLTLVALHATTAGALALALASTLLAARIARRSSGWRSFLGLFGLLLGVLSAAAVAFAGVAPLVVPACA